MCFLLRVYSPLFSICLVPSEGWVAADCALDTRGTSLVIVDKLLLWLQIQKGGFKPRNPDLKSVSL